MAIQLLPRGESSMGLLSRSLGTGLGQGLERGFERNRELNQLLSSGFTPQEANLMQMLPPKERAPFFEALVSQMGAQQPQQFSPEQFGFPQQRQEMPQQEMQQPGLRQQQQPQSTAAKRVARELPEVSPSYQAAEAENAGLSRLQQGLQTKRTKMEEALMKKAALKETAKFREETATKAQSARQTLRDLDRLSDLEATGKLDTPGYVEFLKRSGLDMPALMNPESEEFQKVAYGFMRDAKNFFGARIPVFELEQFLKTIPSLSQSPEGRKRVIANLKYVNRAALEYNGAIKDIMAKSKGFPPIDLRDKVDDIIGPRLDKLSEKFKQDLAKPVPKSQSKMVTALQATFGNVIGRLPKAVGGAATGAGIGLALGGVPGAVIGGALGGLGGAGGAHINPRMFGGSDSGE